MNFSAILSQFNFIIIFQGFFLALALLFLKKGDRLLNRILGSMFFTFSWSGLYFNIDSMGKLQNYVSIAYTNALSDYIYNPLIFLYVLRLTTKDKKFTIRTWLHFIPVVLLFIYYANYYFAPVSVKTEIFNRGYNYFPYDVAVFAYANLLQLVIYLSMSAFILNRYGKRITDVYSNTEKRNYNWLKFILIINTVAAVICFFVFGTHYAMIGNLLSLLSAILVYTVGYKMLSAPPHLPEFELTQQENRIAEQEPHKNEVSENAKYERSGLNSIRSKQLADKLLEFMATNKPYLAADLNVKQLADMLGCQPHHLSQVINQHCGKNFYDLINTYRVKEVKARITDPVYDHLTLLAIAFDSGFNSKASFNSVFKKLTGKAPSAFKKDALIDVQRPGHMSGLTG